MYLNFSCIKKSKRESWDEWDKYDLQTGEEEEVRPLLTLTQLIEQRICKCKGITWTSVTVSG